MKSKRSARPGMAALLPASGQRFELQTMQNILVHTMLILATVAVPISGDIAAQVTLYDNLDVPGGQGDIIGPFFQPGDRFAAQPFFTSEYEALSSVTVKLQRRGNSSGPLELEIWNDADGRPGETVGTFGTVDLGDIDPNDADLVPFNGLVTGLDANSTYYVVLDTVDATIPNDSNSYHIGTTNLKQGTNDAPRLQVSHGRNHDQWAELGNLLPGANFLQMSVTAVPNTFGSGDYDGDGDMDSNDIDLLVAEIVKGTNELTFDLSGDEIVNKADLDQWLSEAASAKDLAAPYLAGDSNLDGSVDSADLNNLALGWRQDLARWTAGDFTADGRVNALDLNELGLNWQQSIANAASPVPEPGIALLYIGTLPLLLAYRRVSR